MGIFSWIFLGLIAGALAKFILPGKDPGGLIVTIIIGIVGALLGGFLGSLIGLGTVPDAEPIWCDNGWSLACGELTGEKLGPLQDSGP